MRKDILDVASAPPMIATRRLLGCEVAVADAAEALHLFESW